MNTTIQSIHLDLEGCSMPPTVNIQKGDNKKTLKISLWNGLRRYQLTPDIWPVLSAKKPDGNSLYNVCEIKDNEIVYHFTEQTSNCLGLMKAELKLYGGSQQLITTMYFFIAVHETVFQAEDAAKSKDEQTALDALVNRTQQQSLILHQKLKNGDFNGESAYEIAVRLGYTGTETEWIQSLSYDHSEEFTILSQQTVEASNLAEQSAGDAVKSKDAAAQSSVEAQGSATEAARAASEAGTQAQLAAASAESSANAEKAASAKAAEAKQNAEFIRANKEKLENSAYRQEVSNALQRTLKGETVFANDISPVPHLIKCKVENVSNLSDIVITYCGKNIYKPPEDGYISESTSAYPILRVSNSGMFHITGTATISGGRNTIVSPTFFLPAGIWTASFEGTKSNSIVLVDEAENRNLISNITGGVFKLLKQSAVHWGVNTASNLPCEWDDHFYIQIEPGYNKTSYSPYIPPVSYHPDLESGISQIPSIDSEMVFYTNASNAILSVQYNQDINSVIAMLINRLNILENNAVPFLSE